MRYSETLVKTCTARVLDVLTQSRKTRKIGERRDRVVTRGEEEEKQRPLV